jgi:ATP-dependent Clp protease ATP-binding subunit ClpA
MYERFTDRARKVMQYAKQEAQRFNHEYIGTEHILLGLVKEGSGVAANVLKNLDIDLRKIRLEVEKIVQAGPDMVTMGKLPQTPRAKKVIEYAIEEARNLNHNYVGSEHLLLGLLREDEGVAAQVLMNMGLELVKVREEVMKLLGQDLLPDAPSLQKRNPPAADLPDHVRTAVGPLDADIQRLGEEKEEAVAQQDFEKAAHLRDQQDKLKKKREKILRSAKTAEPKLVREYELLLALRDKDGNDIPSQTVGDVKRRLLERFEGFLETRLRVDGTLHIGQAILRGEILSFRLFAEVIEHPRDFFLELKRELDKDFAWRDVAVIERAVEVL